MPSYIELQELNLEGWATLIFKGFPGENPRRDNWPGFCRTNVKTLPGTPECPLSIITRGFRQVPRWASGRMVNNTKKLLEIEKEIVREVVRGDKHNLRKSANRNAQISVIHSEHSTDLCFAICRFSQVVFVPSNNFTHNLLFYFQ